MISLFDIIPDNVKMIQYADDLVLMIEGDIIAKSINVINLTLDNVAEWLDSHKLKISPLKSSAVIFNNSYRKLVSPNIRIKNNIIVIKENVKYLGVSINNRLNWNVYVQELENKTQKGLNIMRAIRGIHWGADPSTMLSVYKGLIRSHLDYAYYVLRPCSKKNIKYIR